MRYARAARHLRSILLQALAFRQYAEASRAKQKKEKKEWGRTRGQITETARHGIK
jgi:hypothetical protein